MAEVSRSNRPHNNRSGGPRQVRIHSCEHIYCQLTKNSSSIVLGRIPLQFNNDKLVLAKGASSLDMVADTRETSRYMESSNVHDSKKNEPGGEKFYLKHIYSLDLHHQYVEYFF